MPRPYSEDLRWRAIWMKEMLGFQVDEVAAALWMSPRTIVPLKLSLVPLEIEEWSLSLLKPI